MFFAIPKPPFTINDPELIEVDSVVFCIVAIPFTLRFFATPTPPETTIAPLVNEVESVLLNAVIIPVIPTELLKVETPVTPIEPPITTLESVVERIKFPPMYVFPFIEAPPCVTLNAPSSKPVAGVTPIILIVSGIKLPNTVIF